MARPADRWQLWAFRTRTSRWVYIDHYGIKDDATDAGYELLEERPEFGAFEIRYRSKIHLRPQDLKE